MAKGSGSAIQASILAMALLCLLIQSELAEAAVYKGWTFNAVGWPNGKRFRAGDVLGKTPFVFIKRN
jgi:hypothetical protein